MDFYSSTETMLQFYSLNQCSILLNLTFWNNVAFYYILHPRNGRLRALHCGILSYVHSLVCMYTIITCILQKRAAHTHTHTHTQHTHTYRPMASFPSGGSWPEFVTFLLISCIKNTEKQHKRVKHETISGKWKDPGGEALRERERGKCVNLDRGIWQTDVTISSSGSVWLQLSSERKNKFISLSLIFLTRLSGCDEARGEILHLHLYM